MNLSILIFTLIIQMVIQLSLYFSTAPIYHAVIKNPIRFFSMGHWILGMKRQDLTNGMVSVSLILYNIALSLLVLKFTATSTLAGITNLGASVGVGVFMALHFRKGGKYYIETKEKHLFKEIKSKIRRIGRK